jgi:hypothetical protein
MKHGADDTPIACCLTSAELRERSATLLAQFRSAHRAHVFGLTRMFQVYAEKTRPNTVVVHTLDEAREYLALPRSAA